MIVIKDIEELEKLRLDMQKKLQMNLILQSLTSSYSQFIINFCMNKFDCTIPELVNMLVTMEGTLKSSKGIVLAVEQTSSSKKKSTGKKKVISTKEQKKECKLKKDGPKMAEAKKKYFHYHTEGHWRKNCPKYLESLKTKRVISLLKVCS